MHDSRCPFGCVDDIIHALAVKYDAHRVMLEADRDYHLPPFVD